MRPSAMTTARFMRFSNSRTLPGHAWAETAGVGGLGEAADAAAELPVESGQEVVGQQQRVAAAVAQRRNAHRDGVHAVEQVAAERALVDLLLEARVGRGDDAHIDLDRAAARRSARSSGPAGSAAASPAAGAAGRRSRRGTACRWLALSILPMVCFTAPVNAPRSWPNSSDSSRFSGIAPQLMATNGCLARGPRSCSACASASLPVPLSPSSSTGTLVVASFSMSRQTFSIAWLAVMIRSIGERAGIAARRRFSSSSRCRLQTALDDRAQHLELDRLLAEIVGAEADRLQRVPALAIAGDDDHLGLGRDAQHFIQRGEAFATRHPDRAAGRDP